MRGRPRKHAAIKMLDGTLQHHRDGNGADMRPATGECQPVRQLNRHGAKFFNGVLRAYPVGTLGESDSEALTTCAEWVQAQHRIEADREGMDIATYIKLKAEASKNYLQHAVRFGLTPADRGKVKLTGPAEGEAKEAKFFGVTG